MTVADKAAPAEMALEGTVTSLTELAVSALPAFGLPSLEGEPANESLKVVPQPISVPDIRSTAVIKSAWIAKVRGKGRASGHCIPE